MSAVRELLHHAVPMARRRAADALAYAQDEGSIDALIAALSDADPDVRQDVTYALEKISGRKYGQDAARWKAWEHSG